MRATENPVALEALFKVLEKCAIKGERCPENGSASIPNNGLVGALARSGRIRVKISGHNYRTIEILTGEHAGKSTRPDPKHKPWKIIDKDGTCTRRVMTPPPGKRRQPSPPQLLGAWR